MATPAHLNRAVLTTLLLLFFSGGFAMPASAETQLDTEYSDAERICRTKDKRLDQVSGAVALGDGYVVQPDRELRFISLSGTCQVTGVQTVAAKYPVDAEDLARGPDGTLWIADTGGNRLDRRIIKMVGLLVDGTSVKVRFEKPAPSIDIESAIVTQDYQLVLISKQKAGFSRVYTAPLTPKTSWTPAALDYVGVMNVNRYRTDDERTPSRFVTGAALSPDGMYVAIRTASDVFEYDVTGVDIARELVTATPRWVGRATQPQGEAITYTPDGTGLVLFSEQQGSPVLRIDIVRTYRGADLLPTSTGILPLLVAAAAGLTLLATVAFGLTAHGRRKGRPGHPGRRPGRWFSLIGRPWVVAFTAIALVVWSATLVAAPRLQSGWTSTAVVALTPRSPTTTGADTMVLLGPRYVALLDRAALVESAARNVGVSGSTLRKGAVGLIQPETLNMEIEFTGEDPAQAARSANALAGAIISVASQDPLAYAVRVTSALPTPREPGSPQLRDLLWLGGLMGLGLAAMGGVLVRRRWPA